MTGTVQLPPLKEFETSGGLKVIIARREPIPLVSIRLVFRAGSSLDPQGRFGLADFTAHLLRRGTARMSADEVNDAIEFAGAGFSAGASEDFSAMSLTTPARHLEPMLELFAQLVQEPVFPEAEVDIARRRVLAELANSLDDPSLVADRALQKVLWGDHPYGHDTGGTARDVALFTRDDVVKFHQRHYGPKVSLLVVTGAFDPVEVRKAVESVFGGWKGGPESVSPISELTRAEGAGRLLLLDKPDQTQSQVRIAGMGMRRGVEDWIPASVMNITLGGGFTSRLVNEIRVNRGLSYGAGSGFDGMLGGGTFTVSTFTKTDSTAEIISVALGELRKMHGKGPKPAELSTAQTYLAGLYPLRLETNESVGAAIAETRLYGLGDDWIPSFRDRVRAVTRKRASEVAERYLPVEKPALVVVGNAAKVKKMLAGFGPVDIRPIAAVE